MTTKRSLTSGPSRERLFDCLRLHSTGEVCVVDFWEETVNDKCRSGHRLDVEIQGLHEACIGGRQWYFWGRLKHCGSGSTWKPFQDAPYGQFVFGIWDTNDRRGRIQYSDTSFFVAPKVEDYDK